MKNSNDSDFSQGKVSSAVIRLGLPIMVAELVHVLYNLVDRMYIGHIEGSGTLAMTGLGIALPLITLINAFAQLCGQGGVPLSSIARGEKDLPKANAIMENAFTLLITVGAVLSVLLYAVSPWALGLLGGDEETLPYALGYFRIYVLGTIPVMISLGMNSYINSQGFPKVGMITVIIGAVLNLVLDPLFIFVLDMGVAGAAWATVISQTVSALWVLRFLRGKKTLMRLGRLHLEWETVRSILKLGVTGFCFKVTNSITAAVCNVTLKRWGGELSTLYVGAMSVINSIREITSLPTLGTISGSEPVMSYNYGAKKPERVAETIRFVMKLTLAFNLVIWAIVQFFPEPLIRIFTPDEELIGLTARCMRLYFAVFPFMTLQMTGQHTFVALNHPRHALFFSLLRKIGLVLPFTLLLPVLGMEAKGVFAAEALSQLTGATACFLTMYLTIYRRLKRGEMLRAEGRG